MKYASSRLKSSTGCQRVKHGPRTILLKLLTILLSGSPFRWWTRQQLTAGLIPQQSQLKRSMSPARRPFRAISARTVELVGINQFQMFATVNIKKFPRGIAGVTAITKCSIGHPNGLSFGSTPPALDQVISNPEARTAAGACTWSGPQAASVKLSNQPVQASSDKRQAPSCKLQASSHKQQAP